MTPADDGAAGVTLYREIDALGGAAESEWDQGYSQALTDVLAILTRRGFSEHAEAGPVTGLRDRLAGQALAGAMASDCYNGFSWPDIASSCYAAADAMLAERAK